MNVCGVLVHTAPERTAEVGAGLAGMPGVELHGAAPAGRLIVTVEDTAAAAAIDSLTAIHRLPGVIATALVYHHFEPPGPPGAEHPEA